LSEREPLLLSDRESLSLSEWECVSRVSARVIVIRKFVDYLVVSSLVCVCMCRGVPTVLKVVLQGFPQGLGTEGWKGKFVKSLKGTEGRLYKLLLQKQQGTRGGSWGTRGAPPLRPP